MTDARQQLKHHRPDRTAITLPEWAEIEERIAILIHDGGMDEATAKDRAMELYWLNRDRKEGRAP